MPAVLPLADVLLQKKSSKGACIHESVRSVVNTLVCLIRRPHFLRQSLGRIQQLWPVHLNA